MCVLEEKTIIFLRPLKMKIPHDFVLISNAPFAKTNFSSRFNCEKILCEFSIWTQKNGEKKLLFQGTFHILYICSKRCNALHLETSHFCNQAPAETGKKMPDKKRNSMPGNHHFSFLGRKYEFLRSHKKKTEHLF